MVSFSDLQFLEELGFTNLEIELYCFLLNNPGSTGYSMAEKTGKYRANVYESLSSLKKKGVVEVLEGKAKRFTAVHPTKLIQQIKSKMGSIELKAKKAGDLIKIEKSDYGIFQMKNVDQVYQKFLDILHGCKENAFVEIFPGPFDVLKQPIKEVSQNGINIHVRVYNKETLDGVKIIQSPYGEETFQHWKGAWLSIFADGSEFLMALLSPTNDTVLHAMWSNNPYLAWAFSGYISRDFLYYRMRSHLDTVSDLNELKGIIESLENEFAIDNDPGSKNLLENIKNIS